MYILPIDQNSSVLVTGATGFVGRALVHQLRSLNCHIKVLAREGSEADTLATNYQAELIHGNILSKTTVQTACAGTTHIFHLAGRGQSRSSTKSDLETRRVNVEGTKLLAQAAADEPQLERLLHLSTAAVHGDVTNGPADESSAFSASSTYELTKLESEVWLHNFAQNDRLPLTVVRPCAIVGPGDQRLLKLFKLATHRIIPLFGEGTNRYQIIHIDDCIQVLLAAAQADIAIGEAYICGNSETLTLRELLDVICTASHNVEPRILSIPIRPVKATAEVLDKLCEKFNTRSPLPASRLAFFDHSHWFDTAKVDRDLGVVMRYDNESAIRTTRDWYVEHEWL